MTCEKSKKKTDKRLFMVQLEVLFVTLVLIIIRSQKTKIWKKR